ncbi:MAG TPA: ABC transporter substrate-binding protein [Candidatus Limnocylindrales bacterium]
MTRTDTAVVGTLVALLALIAALIGGPAIQLAAAPVSPSPSAATGPGFEVRPYIEGVLGKPASVSPLTARTQADRDLVALLFPGLVRNGPGGTVVSDLAERWSVDKTGTTWLVDIRADARWHDGSPVTADDVVFTIETLQDPAYKGPSGTSWSEVTVAATGERQVRFTLKTPLGGFLQALTQPIAPVHLLGDIPVANLGDDPFGGLPIGSGAFAITELSDASASLVPAEMLEGSEEPSASPSSSPDSLATPTPTARPSRPMPYLPGIDFRFYDDATALAADFEAGELDGASGLPPATAAALGKTPGARLLRYPGATLTAALLNLRPGHPEFTSPGVRSGLLAAIDRDELADTAFAGMVAPATGLIPPSSPMYDKAASPAVPYSRRAAEKAFSAAKWVKGETRWRLPNAKKPLTIEVLSPTKASNPGLYAAAEIVVRDWIAVGIGATHVALPPSEFVTDRLSAGKFQVAVADLRIGLDPDLYPLLASSQTLTGGSNVMGVQSAGLDTLLEKARAPGSGRARMTAYSALQSALAAGRFVLPLAFADEVVVYRDTVKGPSVRQVTDGSDRFWDVLTWRLAVDR